MRLVPREAIWSCTCCCAPWPTPTVAITAPTPMMMPSMVNSDRILLRVSARIAMRKIASKSINTPLLFAFCFSLCRYQGWLQPSRKFLVIHRRQRLQRFSGAWPFPDRIVVFDLAVAKHDDPFCVLRDIRFVRDQNNGQAAVIQV